MGSGTSTKKRIGAIIGTLASLIAIFVFLTGKNLPDIIDPGFPASTGTPSAGIVTPYSTASKTSTAAPSPVITNSPISQVSVKTGSTITFGKYKNEEINWYVVDVDRSADTALLVSVKAVDVVQYHSSTKTTAWADCNLRYWLNNTFYQAAFSQKEKNYILTSTVEGCSDKVYILSQQEVRWYLSAMGGTWWLEGSKLCYTSNTETGRPIYKNDSSKGSSWWLRTPTTGENASVVGGLGVDPDTNKTSNGPTSKDNGVRPAVLVSLNLFR